MEQETRLARKGGDVLRRTAQNTDHSSKQRKNIGLKMEVLLTTGISNSFRNT